MRKTRLVLPWSAGVMLVGTLASACATATTQSPQSALRVDPGIARFTGKEQVERADSARAQMIADEVGPRVTITADFDYAGGSREVQARFHMYDDGYVVVGHLDAAGRLKIVFPSNPGDDGFVRGDKIYYVPSFFAGFADEYSWRYSDYRYRYHSIDSRHDSYDAGLGYVFVIASWRPMRLDRIANGNRWQTYDVSDVSYMSDPREAIEELGSVIAGDNREAYTIQYAHYSTTNYGTYSLADFDAVNSGCYGYGSFGYGGFGLGARSLFFSPFGFLSSFGYGYGPAGCGRGYSYYSLAYGYPGYAGYPTGSPIFRGPPPIRPPVGSPPIGAPIFRRPSVSGVAAWHKPEATGVTPAAPMGSATTNGVSVYHRPGLITEDAGAPRGQGRRTDLGAQLRGESARPNIQEMIGRRRIEEGARAIGGRDAAVRGDNSGWASRQPSYTNRGGAASRPRDEGGVYRSQGRGAEGSHPSPSYSRPSSTPRSQPAPRIERSEPSHSAPARVEPAPRPSSTSPRSSSSSPRKP